MSEATDAQVRDEQRARARADRTDRLLSASAGIVAASALAVSVYQAYITRQQQRLSAWPYVVQYHSTAGGYRYAVRNVGVGPAVVRSMRVAIDGRPVRAWRDVVRAAFGDSTDALLAADSAAVVTSTFGRGSVLLPGDAVTMVDVRGRRVPAALSRTLANDARFVTTVCYCSLYGECWSARSDEEEPRAVGECRADPKTEFKD
jgi:hypothetical protein